MKIKNHDDVTMWYTKEMKKIQQKRNDLLEKVGIKTLCFCDCGNELVTNSKDGGYDEEGNYSFICKVCGTKSTFAFDAPAPIRVDKTLSY